MPARRRDARRPFAARGMMENNILTAATSKIGKRTRAYDERARAPSIISTVFCTP